jgi:hypothetical protein
MCFKECLIVSHLSIGDQFIINGIVRYFSLKYSKIYLLCKRSNLKSIISIYSDNNSIIPISVDTNNYMIDNDHYIFDLYKDCDIIKIGIFNNNWYIYKSNFIIQNLPYLFFETFYKQLNLEYNLRYKFEKIYRNYKREEYYFNKIMEKYIINDSKYIFIHDENNSILKNITENNCNINRSSLRFSRENTMNLSKQSEDKELFSRENIMNLSKQSEDKELFSRENTMNLSKQLLDKELFSGTIVEENTSNNISIFHPNYNYYPKYCNGIISDNITDYCKILENSYEIHVIFSSFFNLCTFLDLSKVTKKYIYTNIANIKDLHINLKDWNIIPIVN